MAHRKYSQLTVYLGKDNLSRRVVEQVMNNKVLKKDFNKRVQELIVTEFSNVPELAVGREWQDWKEAKRNFLTAVNKLRDIEHRLQDKFKVTDDELDEKRHKLAEEWNL